MSTKQHVLRMMRFDAMVCHPHQCMLAIMETLVFGVGRGYAMTGGGRALRCSIRLLRCLARPYCSPLAAASANEGGANHGSGLAHDDDHGDACRNYESDDDRNAAAAAATLPHFWWRALDVSTENIANAMDTLREECTWKGW